MCEREIISKGNGRHSQVRCLHNLRKCAFHILLKLWEAFPYWFTKNSAARRQIHFIDQFYFKPYLCEVRFTAMMLCVSPQMNFASWAVAAWQRMTIHGGHEGRRCWTETFFSLGDFSSSCLLLNMHGVLLRKLKINRCQTSEPEKAFWWILACPNYFQARCTFDENATNLIYLIFIYIYIYKRAVSFRIL